MAAYLGLESLARGAGMDWVMRVVIFAVAALAIAAGAADALPADNSQAPGFSQQQLGGAASKLVSASVGDIAVVFSRAESHKHFALADIQWMIVPPVVLGQFYVAELAHKEYGVRAPVAAVTWAHVSAEVDQRLRASGGDPPPQRVPVEGEGHVVSLIIRHAWLRQFNVCHRARHYVSWIWSDFLDTNRPSETAKFFCSRIVD